MHSMGQRGFKPDANLLDDSSDEEWKGFDGSRTGTIKMGSGKKGSLESRMLEVRQSYLENKTKN